jgi:uncharacterized membrane protein
MGEDKRMEEKETNRLEAFSDGVFAVAITLLVLNIKIPGVDAPASQVPNDAQLWPMVLNEWPMLAAYVTSFATIGVMWINHHRLYTHIKRTNTMLLLLNLLLLLVIVFVPVPTALVAEYLVHSDQHAAALLYSGTYVIVAICFNLLWRYASYHNRLLATNADTRAVRAISIQYWFGPLPYLVAFFLALFSTLASLTLCFLIALFFALPPRLPRSPSEQSDEWKGEA